MTVPKRSYGVDVAIYQSPSVAYSGARFAVVKLSEGVGYINPRARAQISSAKAHGILPMGYFFATHCGSVSSAKNQARYAVQKAHAFGLPAGSYIADDWEVGDGNYVNGPTTSNTLAVMAAMGEIKRAGYKPLIYSGAYNLRYHLDLHRIVKAFGTCVWVASYKVMGVQYSADFGYFPSMVGVAIWQFTDNWKGYGVDGNISLVPLKADGKVSRSSKKHGGKKARPLSLHPVVKYPVGVVAVVSNRGGAYIYTSAKLNKREGPKLKPQGTCWKVFGIVDGAVKVGHNQYFDGRAVYIKANPIAYDTYKHGRARIVKGTHIFAKPDSKSKKGAWLKAGLKIKFDKRHGKWLHTAKGWITGNRAYIVL